jgi:hypothetical protein
LSEKTSVADWERIMAEGAKSSWKDEWFVIVLSIPLILAFIPGAEGWVDRGFEQLSKAPDWNCNFSQFWCARGTSLF